MDNLKNKTLANNGLKSDIKFMNKLHIPHQKPCQHNHQTVDTMIDSMIDSYIKSRKSLSEIDPTPFHSHPCYFERNFCGDVGKDGAAAAGEGFKISRSPTLSLDYDEQTPRSPTLVTPRQLFHNTKARDMRVLFSRSDDSCPASPKGLKRATFSDEVMVFHEDEEGRPVEKNDKVVAKKENKEKGSKQSTPRKLKSAKSVTDISLAVFEKKFLFIAEKILDSLNEIRLLLSNGVPPPDGEEDAQRRMTRLKEFSSRFSRNFLYSLGRNMCELETPKCNIINQKMLTCYQLILNGLQSYQNHLPCSFGNAAADKITQFINYFNKLAEIHKKFTPLPDKEGVLDLIQAFKMNSDVILQQLVSLINPQMKRALFSSVSTSDLNLAAKKVKSQHGKRLKSKRNSNSNIFARYSMYGNSNAFKSECLWKKTVEYLAKKKYNVKSRYRQINNPNINASNNNVKDYKSTSTISKRSHLAQIQSKSTQSYEGSKCPNNTANENLRQLRRHHLNTTLNEDTLETLVQFQVDGESPKIEEQNDTNERENTEILNTDKQMMMIHGKIATQLYELVQDSKLLSDNFKDLNEINSEIKIQQLIDDCMKNDEGKLVLGKLFTELVRNSNKPLQEIDLDFLQENNIKLNLENNEVKKKERKPPKIKETGEKNARLIIIQDENSIIDEDSFNESKLNKTGDKKVDQSDEIPKNTTETQTIIKSVNRVSKATQKASSKTIKISRLEKKLNALKMLPKNYALNVIQYKIDFKNHTRKNLMYKRTEKIQPVNLMNRISDEIFDYSLTAVTKEMEKMNLAQRIYRSELMY